MAALGIVCSSQGVGRLKHNRLFRAEVSESCIEVERIGGIEGLDEGSELGLCMTGIVIAIQV